MINTMRRIEILLILMIFCFYSFSQKIKNISFSQDGNRIVVNYEINLPELRTANIDLFVSTDGGRSFEGPLKSVTGDLNDITTNGKKSIIWNVFDEYEKLDGNICFEVRANLKYLPFEKESMIAYNISGSSAIGLTYYEIKRIGWYGRIKTNGSLTRADCTADNLKLLDYTGNGYYSFTSKVKHNRIGITGGLVYRVKPAFYIYTGAGFGYRSLLWYAKEYSIPDSQEIGEICAKNVNYSFLGTEAELGMIFRINRLNFSFGVNTINFKFFEANAGIGYFFKYRFSKND